MQQTRHLLARYAKAKVAELLHAKSPVAYEVTNFYDLETPLGKRIDVRTCRIHTAPGSMRRLAQFAFNTQGDGKRFKDRLDFVVCLAFDEEMRIVTVLCIPASELPEWKTSITVSIRPALIRRSNKWVKFQTTLQELKDKLK